MDISRKFSRQIIRSVYSRNSPACQVKFLFKQYGSVTDQSKTLCRQCVVTRSLAKPVSTYVNSSLLASIARQLPQRYLSTQKLYNIVFTTQRHSFHTSGRRHAIPPFVWLFLSPLSKLAAALTGRRLRKWLKQQPPELRKVYRRFISATFAAVFSALAGLATFYYESHLQETPISGRRRFITLNKEQCCKIADYELETYNEKFAECTLPATHPYYQIVVETCRRLVQSNQDIPEMADHTWVVHVVENSEKNAFVLPNGHIFVYTGMLKFCENTDQLAVIMGHEMSHAILMHAAEQLSYTQFLDKAVIVLMTALWTFMPNDGIAVVFQWYCDKLKQIHLDMPYNRSLEKEADNVGLQLAAKACYDIREGTVLWGRMSVQEDLLGKEKVPEWLSTHPTHENRVKHINQLIPKNLELREKCKCPRLPKTDPRVKAQELRKEMDNLMIVRATKANLQRVKKVTNIIRDPMVREMSGGK